MESLTSRRKFLKTSSIMAVGLMTIPQCTGSSTKAHKLGLQLYTLRDTIVNDPKEVLKRVASFGYNELETFAYADGKIFGMDFKEFGKFVKDQGMTVTSGHYGFDIVRGNWEAAVTDAKAIGQEYMVVPWIDGKERASIDDYKKRCEELNNAGEVCNRYGIRLGYHNHAFEFEKIDGQIPYDVMLKELDRKLVGMELDLFWVVNAGYDPLEYFKQYPGYFEQWHVKDMDKSDRNKNADIGAGTIDFKAIFANARQSGMKHFYVEQETYPGEPIDSVAESARYLKSFL